MMNAKYAALHDISEEKRLGHPELRKQVWPLLKKRRGKEDRLERIEGAMAAHLFGNTEHPRSTHRLKRERSYLPKKPKRYSDGKKQVPHH